MLHSKLRFFKKQTFHIQFYLIWHIILIICPFYNVLFLADGWGECICVDVADCNMTQVEHSSHVHLLPVLVYQFHILINTLLPAITIQPWPARPIQQTNRFNLQPRPPRPIHPTNQFNLFNQDQLYLFNQPTFSAKTNSTYSTDQTARPIQPRPARLWQTWRAPPVEVPTTYSTVITDQLHLLSDLLNLPTVTSSNYSAVASSTYSTVMSSTYIDLLLLFIDLLL